MKLFITLVFCLQGIAGALFGGTDPYFSPSSLCHDAFGNQLFVAGGGSGKVLVLDLTTGKVCHEIQFPRSAKVSTADLEITDSLQVGHTPMSPTISEGVLYVCNRFSNTVSAIDLAEFTITGEIETAREPYSMAVSSAGLSRIALMAAIIPATDSIPGSKPT